MKKFKDFVNEAYVNNEKTKQVRTDLKEKYPEFKFSVQKKNYSSVDVAILAGPIHLTDKEDGYEQINHYYIDSHYEDKPEVRDFLLGVYDIINKGNHDNSDIMTDYFDVGFYISLSIGDWDKPYQVIDGDNKKPVKKTKTPVVPMPIQETDVDEDEIPTRFNDMNDEEKPRSMRYFEYNKFKK